MRSANAWLKLWFVWAVPAVLVALNAVWLASVRQSVLGRGSLLESQVKQLEADVARLEAQRRDLVQTENALSELQGNMTQLRADQLGSMSARLVPFLTDFVRRASEVGLRAERIGYSVTRDEKSGLVLFTASYGLHGSYEQLRRCVASLESSPQFVILKDVGLRGEAGAMSTDVALQMTVATYFSSIDEKLVSSLGAGEARDGR